MCLNTTQIGEKKCIRIKYSIHEKVYLNTNIQLLLLKYSKTLLINDNTGDN